MANSSSPHHARRLGPHAVQRLRMTSNKAAHVLFVIYSAIERAMMDGHSGVDDPLALFAPDDQPPPFVVEQVFRKLREDGFLVGKGAPRTAKGKYRISWNQRGEK